MISVDIGFPRRDLVESFESALGDPHLPDNAVSFARAWQADENDALPVVGLRFLSELGWQRYLVPRSLGGELASCEDILWLTRVLARRDMNVAVSESTQIWSLLVWLAGNDEQCRDFAGAMLAGGVIPCLAYSESAHGADLGANECVAVETGDAGYLVSGKKWPINRGSSSTHVLLLARTGGPGAFHNQSLFLLDKETMAPDTVTGLPRTATFGLRGCDISGIEFDRAYVPASALLGGRGKGLELALRGLMLTRTLCSGLSLGVGDTLLRVALAYLNERPLYGGVATDIPHVRETLANAYLNLLAAECVGILAMRGLHLFESEFSTWSSITKVQVSRLVDGAGDALSKLLGARHFIRDLEHEGIFQKTRRDGSVVSMFDGSEAVCLDGLAVQLPAMARAYSRQRDDDWAALYDLGAPLPDWEPGQVSVFGRGRDAVFASLPYLQKRLARMQPDDGCNPQRIDALRTLAHALRCEIDGLFTTVTKERQRYSRGAKSPEDRAASAKDTPTRLVRLAERCCELHMQVACLGIWLVNRDRLGRFFGQGAWLQAILARSDATGISLDDLDPATIQHLFTRMEEQWKTSHYFSILSMPQAAAGSRSANGRMATPPDAAKKECAI
ncbi:acyl-CoA dehydrogenase family protein [Streptomyces hygroscopicus]|uniref:acyl-CoA dehydrogenase family protein n=1 Tax=Streptomyces hygroscopicus TaxID=1912 RepID=UPI00082BB944|nr:acyl-CoA dehydrogenase [Streptomyces hygroscopicus]GLV78351.1 acyl-CoA dehydrogenase [Streptomyces hygroscopicus subsp. hygroscopicus]